MRYETSRDGRAVGRGRTSAPESAEAQQAGWTPAGVESGHAALTAATNVSLQAQR